MDEYKLLIVDDEPEIREGLRSFDFEGLGIRLAGCYENGIIAYERILKEPVDLIITDIRMPLMDGLALTERVRREFSFIQTIILTGYDDFDYARKGLQNGVIDYLLKPIDFDDLTESLQKAIGILNERKQIQLRNTILERKAKLSAKWLRRNFLNELLNRSLTPDEIEEGCSAGEIMLHSPPYSVSVMRLDAAADAYSEKDWNLILLVLDNVITEMWTERYGYHFVNRQNGRCFFLAVHPDMQSEDRLLPVLQLIKQELLRFRGLLRTTLSIAVGPKVDHSHNIPLSRAHAEAVLDASPERDSCSGYDAITLQLAHPAPADGASGTARAADAPEPSYSESARIVVEEAKRFINEHYERSITLRDVAESVHVNPSYLSYLFKKTTGENFVVYLTGCRIRKAKRLLTDLQYKIYEVGEMVGFENPRYFCEIFKKYTGRTPQEFRNLGSAAANHY